MERIEIDNIEVSDLNIEVSYWIPGHKTIQQVSFKTSDFEDWLNSFRKTSVSAYWDHWDAMVLDEMGSVILFQDMKRYLHYKGEMLNPERGNTLQGLTSKKPMSRVPAAKKGLADSESA
jgi:hypothetical protein